MENTAKKKKGKKKPLRRAQHWGTQVLPMAGKLLVSVLIVVVLGLIFSALQAVGDTLRMVLTVIAVAAVLLLFVSEGINRGAQDAAASRNYASLQAKGIQLEARDDAACYHPLKAVCAALLVFSLPLALSIVLALTSKAYTYTLQDLPLWLTQSYGQRADVMGPLGAYAVEATMHLTDWARMFVRLFEMNYVNFFGDPLTMGQMIDRLSPLFIFSYPLFYVLGYLCGPSVNRKTEKQNRRAKKVAAHRAKKKSLVEELTGAQGQVHYGQKKQEHKKKELI